MNTNIVRSPWRPSTPKLVVQLAPNGISAVAAQDLVVDYLAGCNGDVPPWKIVAGRLKDSPTGIIIPLPSELLSELFQVVMPDVQPSSTKTRAILRFVVDLHNMLISREDTIGFAIADLLNGGRLELDIVVDPNRPPQLLAIDLSV